MAGIRERVVDEPVVVPMAEGEGDSKEAEHSWRLLRPRGSLLPSVGLGRQR